MSQVVAKDGTKIDVCTYRWVDPEGHVELCRHAAACPVCKQCSRLDGDSELGHCTGHLGLSQHIRVPGQEAAKTRNELERTRNTIQEQRARARAKHKPGQRRQAKGGKANAGPRA